MTEVQQRFFERVELAGEGELDKIRVLLEEALERRLQARSSASAGDSDRQLPVAPFSSNRPCPGTLPPR